MTEKTDQTSQNRRKAATAIWFAVLLGCLMLSDDIATLSPAFISVIAVCAGTILFTSMQIIVRETVPEARIEVRSVQEFRERTISSLALRNLAIISVVYALVWASGLLPF